MLAPDTSHGTNPASVTMAGYEVVKVATNERGGVEMDDLRAKIDDEVACLMLTNPNTLGLFDENIAEIAGLIHEAGGTLYYDGANLNAVMGHSRPGDMGFDIVHVNLHKSFSQPHGGGGPGAGPIAVSERIEPFLPRPAGRSAARATTAAARASTSTSSGPKSIGRLRGFQGNFGVFVRSYAYILSLGADGLAEASETAVLNANYLKARLAEGRAGERLPVAFDRHCMHEFVLSGKPMKKELGLATLDLAKRLLDFGFHPPTVYFPLLVDEALMVEPTETETKESLDAFAEAVEEILAEAEEDPEIARQRPLHDPGPPPRRGPGDARSPVVRQDRSASSSGSSCSRARAPGRRGRRASSTRSQHVVGLEDRGVEPSPESRRRLDLLPGDRGRGGRAARAPAASRRRSSSCAGGSGTSRRRPCPRVRPFSSSRRPGRASASRAAGRSLWRTVWSSS